MEPFDIDLQGIIYTIQPLISENFEVYRSGELIGFLTPTIIENKTVWSSREIEKNLANELGRKIENMKP